MNDSPEQPLPSALQEALLNLYTGEEIRDFWESLRIALHRALPLEFCGMHFRPWATLPSITFRERAPFTTEREFQEFCKLSPFDWRAGNHSHTQLVRLSDVIESPQLRKSEYFRQFMVPTNSRYEACLIYGEGDSFEAIVLLHRASGHGDFTDSEMCLLEQLFCYFQNALRRLWCAHREKARRISLEILLNHLPLATIILDWDLKISYRNRAAEEVGILWNLGPAAARNLKPRQGFEVPTQIMEACRGLKGLPSRVFDQPPISNRESVVIHHEKIRGLQASIRPLQVDGAPLSPPMFLIRLERREDFRGEKDAAAGKLALWANLSPSEQHVAWLASQGHRNAEIAGQLNKSVLTVKKQLQCIYHKLEVSGRGRLIALFN